MSKRPRMGAKIRSLRRKQGLTQAKLAEQLGISASYLNLIEHDRRALSAQMLIKLAQRFELDIAKFAGDDDSRLAADLLEMFGDPMFDPHELESNEVRDLAAGHPGVARAILNLFQTYQGARQSAEMLAAKMSDSFGTTGIGGMQTPSEIVNDFIQRQMNYFPELEEAAEAVWSDAGLEDEDLFTGLAGYLKKQHDVDVRIETVSAMAGAVRRFDARRGILRLSEILRRGTRNFQLAHQVGLLTNAELIHRIAADKLVPSEEARVLCRVALANYFASCILMPYEPFIRAAREERYDLELLGHRFRASFEQICHRLTTLRRTNMEGVPFHFVRVDIAGNLSKRFSASGIRYPRFSGLCPKWNVHAAFLTPGRIRVQLSRLPDGMAVFSVARTVRKQRGGFHAQDAMHAIGLGCDVKHARELVYSDGIDLENLEAATRVGLTCRLCERMDCEQRAFPAIHKPLKVDESVRGANFYTPAD